MRARKMVDGKDTFSARLNEVLDIAGWPQHGRQTRLAELMDISPQAARKWLLGHALPTRVRVNELAQKLEVIAPAMAPIRADWLYLGTAAAEQCQDDDRKALRIGRIVLRAPDEILSVVGADGNEEQVVAALMRPDFKAKAQRTAPVPLPPTSAWCYVVEVSGNQEPGVIPIARPDPVLETLLRQHGYNVDLVQNPTARGAAIASVDPVGALRRDGKRDLPRAKAGRS